MTAIARRIGNDGSYMFICDENQSCESLSVAGAIFGEVGG